MTITPDKAKEYEDQLAKLRFALPDDALTADKWHDIGAGYAKAKSGDERIYVALRPVGGDFLQVVALNPAVAFDLANAILAEGGKAGWFSIASVDGDPVPEIRQ